jgi:hypothetical protein
MAKKNEALGSAEQNETAPAEPTAPRPPQGIEPRHFNTGNPVIDLHRFHRGGGGLPAVRRLDPASLRTPEDHDPFLRFPGGAIIQVRADHAAELLECDELTGGEPRHRLATDDEVAAEKERMRRSVGA